MTRYDNAEPAEVVDRLLDREAQQMLRRHAAADPDGRCRWCGYGWPCPARRLAERAAVAARQPAPRPWDPVAQRYRDSGPGVTGPISAAGSNGAAGLNGTAGSNGAAGWHTTHRYRGNHGAFE